MENLLTEVEEMLNNYSKNIDRIIECYFLSTARICYHVMRLYPKYQDLIPKNYEIDLNQLIDDYYKEFLKKYDLKIGKWRLALDYWSTDIFRWKVIIRTYQISRECYHEGQVKIETNKHGEIQKVESASYEGIAYKNFELLIALPIILTIEHKITQRLLEKIYEAILPKINAINSLVQEINELTQIAAIATMDR